MMRKLFVALLVGAVAVGLAAPAFAADLKFTGAYRVRFQFDENLPCMLDEDVTGLDCSGNQFQTRFRPRFDVETDGGVRGVLRLEIGDVTFGQGAGGEGGGHGADGRNVETKWAYIDFPVPATPFRVKAGIQDFFLSKALFLDDDGSGISLYGKLGEINVNAWWFRPNRTGAAGGSFENQLAADPFDFGTEGVDVGTDGEHARDIYGLDLSMSPMKDLNLNLYFVYDHDMEQSAPGSFGPAVALLTESSTGFWVGAGAAGKVQNIRWDLDFVYGSKETIHPAAPLVPTSSVDQKGWMLDGGVGMALPGTPLDLELRGWWATGWDGKGCPTPTTCPEIDAFPVLYGGSGGHEPGTQVWGGGGAIDIDALADNPQNTWGFGLIARYTATPNLRLTGNVHYIGVVEDGNPSVGEISPIGDGFLFGVDAVGTEVGVKIDYTIAKGLVFTLTGGHLFLAEDSIDFGPGIGSVKIFDDVTKVAGVLNYGF